MYNTEHISNIHIDNFVEKLSFLGVKSQDIADYLHYSVQHEIAKTPTEKTEILDSLFFDFECKYSELNQQLESEITQLYIDTSIFGSAPEINRDELFQKLTSEIVNRLNNLKFSGDFFDLGTEIGLVASKFINQKKLGLKKEDFINGVTHGIKLIEE